MRASGCFTMDLVEGVDFLSYTRPHGELDKAPQLHSRWASWSRV